ncbi:RNA polymerase sigma factor [Streptomyces sp. NPDC020817]|uniref:RNA polymerase sigma factor n=1 Tax=Streptomyces sp. NPDC020817 TaxID=3365095 RepID=UPI00379B808D
MHSPRQETGPPDLTTPEGFGAFYEEHVDAVLGFVTRRVSDARLPADLAADIFLPAMGSAKGCRRRRRVPVAWPFGIARNVLAGHARGRVRESGALARLSGRRLLDDEDVAALEERIGYGIPLAVGLATAAVLGLVALPGGGGGGPRPAGTSSATEPVVQGDGTIVVAWPSYADGPETVDGLRALGVRVAMVQRKPPASTGSRSA